MTALMFACANNQVAMAESLLVNGANSNHCNNVSISIHMNSIYFPHYLNELIIL